MRFSSLLTAGLCLTVAATASDTEPASGDLGPFVVPADDHVVTLPDGFFPGSPKYLTYHLGKCGLAELQEEGSIRFLWLRSFHPPIVFEVRPDGDESVQYTARVWRTDSGAEAAHWETFASKRLSMADHARNLGWLRERWKFFETPTFDDRQGLDGSDWIYEVKYQGRHHWIRRWSPEADALIHRLGMDLIELSIESPVIPIY